MKEKKESGETKVHYSERGVKKIKLIYKERKNCRKNEKAIVRVEGRSRK